MDEEASGTSVVVENTRPSAVDAIASIVPSTSALSAFDLQTNSTSAVLKTIPAQLTDNIPGNSDTPSTANQPSSQRIADTADTDCDDDDENDQPLSDPEDDEFFFESDHLALRGNADYTAVLRTIAILQTQRMLVTKNIDILAAAESRALDDPVAFARQVKTGELQLPGPISVADLPLINFEKYGLTVPDFVPDDELDAQQQSASVNETDSAANNLTVRGRMFDQSKPETFNQLWTCDEQKRLEELLVEYPPEVVEMRRFAKIARALGNRTTKQVASRLQKFFKKLHSAGLPVPGRIPKSNRQNMSKAYRMLRQQAMRTTTFFPANHVPYNITDDLDDSAQLDSNWYRRGCYEGATGVATATIARRTYVVDSGGDDAVDEAVDENVLILRLAQRIKADKEREAVVEMGSSEHVGFACDFCSEEPIIGTRWHCENCTACSIDFCTDCLLTQLQTTDGRHPLAHRIIALRISPPTDVQSDDGDTDDEMTAAVAERARGKIKKEPGNAAVARDKDYNFCKSEYNYLDPNFLPQ